MRVGQTSITALWAVALIFIGIIFSWPVVRPVFLSFNTVDPLMNIAYGFAGVAILAAAFISYFVYLGVGRAQ